MVYLTWKDRLRVPTYDDPSHVMTGKVEVDAELCNGCGMCVKVCPGSALYLEGPPGGKKARMVARPVTDCMSCNDCAAVCERDAISARGGCDYGFYYRTLFKRDFVPPRRF
ncbi:MAG: 4Fe-4S dicluster domain-containing protein [Actinobacteria bacterium]|nr:4Fe-4S dicluster domain-containing protein [Actinomycetota bacterium]MBU1943005.1 4Fe-4S dicluster domain-containing protein [Actinomycetota bacterium]MBU2687755.1 4Fe-4S dicluster domain-containing protein [Actinomycetota bacterium]